MLIGKPILAGDSDIKQLEIIFDLVGSPTEDNMPGWRSLPGADGLNPRLRPQTLSQRFREYGYSLAKLITLSALTGFQTWLGSNLSLK
jgi:serine/threonine-protein kinase BUR1